VIGKIYYVFPAPVFHGTLSEIVAEAKYGYDESEDHPIDNQKDYPGRHH
jgi:hypothetical protein